VTQSPSYIEDRRQAEFARGSYQNPKFWERFGEKPDFRGKTVLDVGCGLGSLCLHIAEAGAARVVGLDMNAPRIDFAREKVRQEFPQFNDTVEFFAGALDAYPADPQFDIIVSKNTFEHILNLAEVVADIKTRLKPGGRLYAGFGPLYYSPFGLHVGHKKTVYHVRIPWAHAILGDAWSIRQWSRRSGHSAESVRELGNNQLTPANYRKIFEDSGLHTVSIRLNRPHNDHIITRLVSSAFLLLRRLPGLEKYFTINMYCVLEKPRAGNPPG
jgi:SAM-dependent methyltransferase